MAGRMQFEDEDEFSEINIVPFVDIILVVLIIFMVTAPVITMTGINVDLFNAMSAQKQPPTKVNVTISADGQVYLNGAVSSQEQIAGFVRQLAEQQENPHAIVSADQHVSHGQVLAIIDAVKAAGAKGLAISTGH